MARSLEEKYSGVPREQVETLLRFRETHPVKRLEIDGVKWEYIS